MYCFYNPPLSPSSLVLFLSSPYNFSIFFLLLLRLAFLFLVFFFILFFSFLFLPPFFIFSNSSSSFSHLFLLHLLVLLNLLNFSNLSPPLTFPPHLSTTSSIIPHTWSPLSPHLLLMLHLILENWHPGIFGFLYLAIPSFPLSPLHLFSSTTSHDLFPRFFQAPSNLVHHIPSA